MTAYAGAELEIFELARNWKAYLLDLMRPYIGGRVLEAGAGLGGTTRVLAQAAHTDWLCLEPDSQLAEKIERLRDRGVVPPSVRVKVGSTKDLADGDLFDTILYVDVIEHIEGDREEFARVGANLAPGGRLIVFSPAHQWLFSPFDSEIGHFRRYTKRTLSAVIPPGWICQCLKYVDSIGILASLANRMLLRSSYPTQAQIALWDTRIVPVSRKLDPLFGFQLGKSILGVWTK